MAQNRKSRGGRVLEWKDRLDKNDMTRDKDSIDFRIYKTISGVHWSVLQRHKDVNAIWVLGKEYGWSQGNINNQRYKIGDNCVFCWKFCQKMNENLAWRWTFDW